MTYGIARAATSPELTLYRAPGKKSKFYAAIYKPATVYTARVNQTFSTRDGILSVTYDGGVGTLSDVKADMIMYIGSTAGARDVGMVRVRDIDATQVYVDQTSEINWQDNQYLTIVADFKLLARHVNIINKTPYMDGVIAYSDQHTNFDPTPIMGSHRVLKLTSSTVSTTFDGSASYVFDSTISSRAWSAPGASATSGMTTNTPTITYNAVGWYLVYLTLTAANGKSFFGVRLVYVWNDDNPPPRVKYSTCTNGVDTGGPHFDITLYRNADVSDVYEGALVILFSEDLYGDTLSAIGQVAGSENIEAIGWIGGNESIQWNPQRGSVKFPVYGAQYWMQNIPAYPDGVEFVTTTPAAWTQMKNLTTDRGIWHFLRWRSTATRIFDCFMSGNILLSKEVSSPAVNLWSQVQEMAALSILGRPGFNAQGQFFFQVHPQLVPTANRTWATVMDIQKGDWIGEINLDRTTLKPLAQLNMSGVAVNTAGVATPYFALSPGHTYAHYGKPDLKDKLLVLSQDHIITLSGLYTSWRNNQFSEFPFPLKFNTRLIDCFPRMKCTTTLNTNDTPRGIAYSGGLIPKSWTSTFDDETGRCTREVIFEAETFEGLAVKGDVPGSSDFTVPPIPKVTLPPPDPVIMPGGIPPGTDGGPPKVAVILNGIGIAYTENFNTASPSWTLINDGLMGFETGVNRIFKTPSGALYCASTLNNSASAFIARADYAGAPWVIIEQASLWSTSRIHVYLGYNPLTSEEINYVVNVDLGVLTGPHFKHGGGTTFTEIAAFLPGSDWGDNISFGNGKWMAISDTFVPYTWDASYGGLATHPSATNRDHIRIGTTADFITGTYNADADMKLGHNFGASYDALIHGYMDSTAVPFVNKVACDPTGSYIMMNGGLGPGTDATPSRSSDGGFTYSLITGLAVTHWRFTYAGGAASASRWIAGADGGYLKYSDDFGGSWSDKLGNLPDLAPGGINIIGICVVEM